MQDVVQSGETILIEDVPMREHRSKGRQRRAVGMQLGAELSVR
jgi:hypothetical protein